ncbi:peroxynitrite isomerase THAP4-like [Dermacentor variabilis]|uniref:peroxynitrite isomerase THAP4-like n=1 Tax=Dermacentor variabilis TaxID=34621 RepID=UPI003F5C5AB9
MPTRCVAVGCSNTYSTLGTSFHMFPRDQQVRKLWVLAVRRENWQPTRSSMLCSAHFKKDDFVYNPSLTVEMPYKMKRVLKPGSVPSAFSRNRNSGEYSPEIEKRRRPEIVNSALPGTQASTVLAITALELEKDEDIEEEADLCAVETDNEGSQSDGYSACCPAYGHEELETSKYVQVNFGKTCAQKATMTTRLHRTCGAQTDEQL